MIVVLKEEGDIEFTDLPEKIVMLPPTDKLINGIEITDQGINYNDLVDQLERDLLASALEKAGGAKNRAAKLLNLNRTTFVEKLRRYKIGQ
jgi:DNA-binding NtrC family response regulator